jgi:hypothetical protein
MVDQTNVIEIEKCSHVNLSPNLNNIITRARNLMHLKKYKYALKICT